MDTSTLLFIAAALTVFLFLKWMIQPIPQETEFLNHATGATRSTPNNEHNHASTTATAGSTTSATSRRNRRPVTDSMIEVVQAIAPQLTPEQIRYDLEQTGSVELTIDKFMEQGTLPFPPDYVPPAPAEAPGAAVKRETGALDVERNLFKRYGIDVENPVLDSDDVLTNRRNKMIVDARARLAKQMG
ncbi:uncharacterized protein LODBEIA_P55980 [Lodderomyces beijingensis]|uniref:CUE domain-containing protein n=1 Tax=Lodderomyces beijingensis TaxID=1775926 RepID=A0ABP0ZU10_9ASCO